MSPLQLYHFVLYTGVFFRELVEANIAVMRYVYAPRIRIRPGILRARTRLRSPIGRLALANSVTLTPGSLVLDTDEDALVVHCLDLTDADREKVAEAIVRPVEKHLEKVFG
jgi:multicomponent Na+:H+ antiporter subunit E